MATGGCCKWGWLVREGDTPDEARIKTLNFPLAICLLLISVMVIANQLNDYNQIVSVAGASTNIFGGVLFMVGAATNAIPAGCLYDIVLMLAMIATLLGDLGSVTRSYPFRIWTLVVLGLDAALVFKRFHMPRYIIPLVLVYLTAMQV
eukprot:Hpha_TRINITY_DN16406_c3_g14::TRINITY_DN16406_c3_g14_i1::g.160205::m.160205